jgi:tRNA(Ile)-lysidine synthase
MQMVQHRNSYTLVRPLLKLDKKELFVYLHANSIKYFQDESNLDEDIKRNSFRHNYASPLLDKYLDGIKKSFDYLDEDRATLVQDMQIKTIKEFAYFEKLQTPRANIFIIDKYLKSKSYMLSASERELLKIQDTLVVGRKFLVNQAKDFVFMVPYKQESFHMPREFKDTCRTLKIEPKLRPYLYENKEAFLRIKELLGSI